jgi:hypothetical protein
MGAPQETYSDMAALLFTVALGVGVIKGACKQEKIVGCGGFPRCVEVRSKRKASKRTSKPKKAKGKP